MNILTIVGARPQFVKAAVVSRAIKKFNLVNTEQQISEDIIHTGQHYDHGMSQSFFDEMSIPEPAVNLASGGGKHGEMTGRMLTGIEKEIIARNPDMLLVYGDTNSTLAGALAAAKLHIPIAHVEAGMRSFNRAMPEEINRVVTDHISSLLFCPSADSKTLLKKEGISQGVHVVGDVMFDAVQFYQQNSTPLVCDDMFILATLHRAENTDDKRRLASIVDAMGNAPFSVILPLHPRTKKLLRKYDITVPASVTLLDPVPYLSMLSYLQKCQFVMTDSGGLQKEACFLEKKCITLRDETEWVDLVNAGCNKVVGADYQQIIDVYPWAMEDFTNQGMLFGDGDAGSKIVQIMYDFHSKKFNG